MSKRKTLIGATCACVILLVIFAVVIFARTNASYRDITVFTVAGTVKVERSGKEIDAIKDMKLKSGDSVEIGDGDSFLRLCIDDDKYLYCDCNTKIILQATGSSENSRTTIFVSEGQIITEVTKKLNGNSSCDLVTPNTTMAIRGTIIGIVSNRDSSLNKNISNNIVFEGSAQIGMYSENGTIACIANEGEGLIFENIAQIKSFGKKTPAAAGNNRSVNAASALAASIGGTAVDSFDPSGFDHLFENIIRYVGAENLNDRMLKVMEDLGYDVSSSRGTDKADDKTDIADLTETPTEEPVSSETASGENNETTPAETDEAAPTPEKPAITDEDLTNTTPVPTPEQQPLTGEESVTPTAVPAEPTPTAAEIVTTAPVKPTPTGNESVTPTPAEPEPAEETITPTPTENEQKIEESVTPTPAENEQKVEESVTPTPAEPDTTEETETPTPSEPELSEETVTPTPSEPELTEETVTPTPSEPEPAEETVTPTPPEPEPAGTVPSTPTPSEPEPTVVTVTPTPSEPEPTGAEPSAPTPSEPEPAGTEPTVPTPSEPEPGGILQPTPGPGSDIFRISLIYHKEDESVILEACENYHISGDISERPADKVLTFEFTKNVSSQGLPSASKQDENGAAYDLVWKHGADEITAIPSDISSDMDLHAEWKLDHAEMRISIKYTGTGKITLKDVAGWTDEGNGIFTYSVNDEAQMIRLPEFYEYKPDNAISYDYCFFEPDGYRGYRNEGNGRKLNEISYREYKSLKKEKSIQNAAGVSNDTLELAPLFKNGKMNVIELFIQVIEGDMIVFESASDVNEMYVIGDRCVIAKDESYGVFTLDPVQKTFIYEYKSLYYDYYASYNDGNRMYPLYWKNCKNNGLNIGGRIRRINNGITEIDTNNKGKGYNLQNGLGNTTQIEKEPELRQRVGSAYASWALIPVFADQEAYDSNLMAAQTASGSAIKVSAFNSYYSYTDIQICVSSQDDGSIMKIGKLKKDAAGAVIFVDEREDEYKNEISAGMDESTGNSQKLLIEFLNPEDKERYKLIFGQ